MNGRRVHLNLSKSLQYKIKCARKIMKNPFKAIMGRSIHIISPGIKKISPLKLKLAQAYWAANEYIP